MSTSTKTVTAPSPCSGGVFIPINEILARKVSLFKTVFAEKAKRVLSLDRFIGFIRDDEGLKKSITDIRDGIANGESEEWQCNMKRRLPAVTISGIFPCGRTKDSPIEHTGLFQVGIDKIEPCKVGALIDQLRRDPHVVVVFRSARGNLKAIVAVPRDASLHRKSYYVVSRYFRKQYGVKIDHITANDTRMCYLSHDPDIHVAAGPVLQFEVKAHSRGALIAKRSGLPDQACQTVRENEARMTEDLSVERPDPTRRLPRRG